MIEAMVISVGEPQLERCLNSVRTQKVPFSNVIHLDGIVPNSKAFNLGMEMTKEEWVMHIGGDLIPYDNASEIAEGYVRTMKPMVCSYSFWILDTFLECDTGFCSVFNTKAFKDVKFKDTLWDDRHMMHRLRAKGWKVMKPRIVIATHFDKPDDFQVFGRFYFHGSKFADNSFVRNRMSELYGKTKDPLYLTGVKAIEFAKIKKLHPGSPNVDFAREMYNEWKNSEYSRVSQIEN